MHVKRTIMFICSALFVTCLITFTFISTSAEQEEPNVRIGVVPNAEQVTIGSEGSFEIIDKVTGQVLFTGTNDSATVFLESSGGIHTFYTLQVAWTTSWANVEEWVTRAESLGYTTYIEEYNGGWRMHIGEFPEDAPWGERNDFRNEVIALGLAGTDSFWRIVTISEGISSLKVIFNGEEKVIENEVLLQSDNNIVQINGVKYRGIAEVGFNSNGTLAGINELPVEQYLKGVVPRELPPEPFGEIEAQKSQAIAARTYTFANIGKRSADGYDLLPTTSDQVYGGYEAEHPVSSQAVDDTRGIVATYNGQLITAVYHSTSGGFTANNEDVWNSDPVPYLRGVPDHHREIPLNVNSNNHHTNGISLRTMNNDFSPLNTSRYHRWTFEWTPEEITQVLSNYYGTDVGEVYEINVLKRAKSGRVLEIEYVTENGTFYEYKDRIRWSLPYINANGDESVLLSTLFYILPTNNGSNNERTGFIVHGGGWGHGVGLSQTGAVGMAEKGKTYEEILKHYYRGIELEVLY